MGIGFSAMGIEYLGYLYQTLIVRETLETVDHAGHFIEKLLYLHFTVNKERVNT